MDNKAIGLRIEQRRKQLSLTLEFVATEVGVAKSTIMRYERGTIEKVKLPVIEAIARVLDVNPSWLCCKSDEMFVNNEQLPSMITEELSEIDSIFSQLTPSRQTKLLELARLYLDDQRKSEETE